jgi:AraC family transcriptional regulator
MKGNWPKLQPVIAKAAREANDQTLSDLAAALGLSPSHAHRILTESLGETPKEYTLRLRLDRAAGMLATTRDTILDIALVCGFESHEVFARAFRRRFGITPSAYRKRGLAAAGRDQAREHAAVSAEMGPCIGLIHLDTRRKEGRTNMSNYEIAVQDLERQPILIVRRRVPRSDIGMTIGTELRAVFLYAQANAVAMSGHPITRYPEYGVGFVTLETGMRVTSHGGPGEWTAGDGDGNVIREELPAGPAATVVHCGPYEGLQDAYAAVEQWIQQNGRQASGAPWEVYLNDPGDFPDPKDWKTAIFWPLNPTA